jgi:glycopeptide antibiotics resistance protein
MTTTATRPAPPTDRSRIWLSIVALLVYGGIVLVATLTPTTLDNGFESSIDRLLAVAHRHGMPEWFDYARLEFTANIGMFVPLAFIVAMLLPSTAWWLALLICPALSVCIELAQATFLSGRFATVSDVVANSIGSLIGALLAFVIRAVIRHRDERVVALAIWRHDHYASGISRFPSDTVSSGR